MKAPVDTGVAPLPVEDTAEVIEAKKAHFKAMDEAKSRTTRQIPLAYAAHPVVYSAPAAVEHTIKSVVLEPNAAEKTPAATTLLQEKEITQKVVTPLTYGVAPFATPYAGYPYHYAAGVRYGRKKRQSGGFENDFAQSSVDLNQDGFPDNYQVFPYAYSYPYYAGYSAVPYYG